MSSHLIASARDPVQTPVAVDATPKRCLAFVREFGKVFPGNAPLPMSKVNQASMYDVTQMWKKYADLVAHVNETKAESPPMPILQADHSPWDGPWEERLDAVYAQCLRALHTLRKSKTLQAHALRAVNLTD